MHKTAAITDIGERIGYISGQFLNIPYKESTLTGSITIPEALVINLEGMDCMTFIEYIEAMRLSGSFKEFTENLKKVRYRDGEVSYKNRRHFFTDWTAYSPRTVKDVTTLIGGIRSRKIIKRLNLNPDGTYLLNGIPPTERELACIPADAVDDKVVEKLRTGDYVGIYSDRGGLDVSHTGIIIKDERKIHLRHASSRKATGQVLDEDLKDYLERKPGLIVLRYL
ncbi:MAG: DUF1460 domain-containing protein [Nitrospirae bacterium]|nr:DUF1460 domain-containing protein [Nitrospirota bacterium]